jgi:uncharacterized membrane protein YccC
LTNSSLPRTGFRALLRNRRTQIFLALRNTISALLALVLATAFGLPLPLWSVLTALILTQASLGRSLRASIDYMIGTLGGALYGGAIAVLIPHTTELALLGVLAIAIAPLLLLAAINPRMNTAPITAVIVLLLPGMHGGSPIESAINRVIEVGLGAITGLAVSLFVFPSSAHRQALEAADRTLELMAIALHRLLADIARAQDVETLHRIQDGVGESMTRLDAIAEECAQERSARLASEPPTGPLLRTLLRLRHDLVIVGRAVAKPEPEEIQTRLGKPLQEVSTAFGNYMRGCGKALVARSGPPPLDAVRLALERYAQEVAAVRSEGLTRALSAEEAERFFALGFALEQVHQNFRDLERCVNEWSQTEDAA